MVKKGQKMQLRVAHTNFVYSNSTDNIIYDIPRLDLSQNGICGQKGPENAKKHIF